MDGLKAMGTGARAALLAGGAVIAAATGYGIWSVNQDPAAVAASAESPAALEVPAAEGAAPEATAAAPALEPVAEPAPEQAAEVPEAPQAPDAQITETEAIAPTFDLVRVEPDGQALVAGQAEPGSKIVLRLDGAEISGSTADAQGNFAVLFVLDPSTSPRMLTMGSILPGQQEIASLGEVALAPTTAAVVAAAEPVVEAPIATAPETAAAETPPEAAPAADAPAALLITKDGVNVLQSGDQSVAEGDKTDLSIDTISYTAAGDVQLAGRADAEAVLRVYLDNAPLLDVIVGDDGRWASTMPAIEPGIYTLRVDALAADGTVTARFETPFKRETQDALAAAVVPEAATAGVPEAAPDVVAEASAPAEPAPEAPVVEAPAVAIAADEPAAVEAPEASTAAEVPAEDVATAPVAPAPIAQPVSITVQPGFTLWGIATEQFGDGVLYVQVFEANKDKIRDPNLIYPGQVFVIPAGSE